MTPSRNSLRRPEAPARLRFGHAVALGALHGPAELLPISSSGHTTAIPWLLGSGYTELEPDLRKALEVALHAGTALGLLIGARSEIRRELRGLDRHHLLVLVAASAPAGAAGLLLERRIEASLGTPATIAIGLLTASLAMALADLTPQERRTDEAGLRDAVWLGLAQATALAPGISRGGATLAAARARRFRRADASRLSGELAWPVIGGATLLKGWRLRQSGLDENLRPLLAGGASSLISTLLAARLRRSRAAGSLLPYVLYRTFLAVLILLRLWLGRDAHHQGHARSA